MNENEEVAVNRKEVSENSEESYEDSRRVITRQPDSVWTRKQQ